MYAHALATLKAQHNELVQLVKASQVQATGQGRAAPAMRQSMATPQPIPMRTTRSRHCTLIFRMHPLQLPSHLVPRPVNRLHDRLDGADTVPDLVLCHL